MTDQHIPPAISASVVCRRPFENVEVQWDGGVYICSPSWTSEPIGNLMEGTLEQIWQSEKAYEIRRAVSDATRLYVLIWEHTEPARRCCRVCRFWLQVAFLKALSRLANIHTRLTWPMIFRVSWPVRCADREFERLLEGLPMRKGWSGSQTA